MLVDFLDGVYEVNINVEVSTGSAKLIDMEEVVHIEGTIDTEVGIDVEVLHGESNRGLATPRTQNMAKAKTNQP